jgi:amino acid transporter
VAILTPFAAGFTAMSATVRSAGGFYAIAGKGLGPYAAGSTSTIAIFSYTSIQVGLYGLFGAAAAALLNDRTGLVFPWWACSAGAMMVIGVLGYRQVDLSARVLSVLVMCEYVVVLYLDVINLTHSGTHISLDAFQPSIVMSGTPSLGLLMCFTAFIGFEATSIYAEEAKDPARTVPIATYMSLFLIGIFYVFSSWCMVVAVGSDKLMPVLHALADPTVFLFNLSDQYVGSWLTLTMRLLFLTSIFAAMLAFHNSIARYMFAMGREGLLWPTLGRTHPQHASPHIASMLQTTTAAVLLLIFVLVKADPVTVLFARVSAVGTLGVIALMGIASAAVFAYFIARDGNLWRVRIMPLVASISLLAVLAFGCYRFDVLAGGVSEVITWLPALLLLAAVLGLVLARRLRLRDAESFRRLGDVII